MNLDGSINETYRKITIQTASQNEDIISSILFDFESSGLYIEPAENSILIHAYFKESIQPDKVDDAINKIDSLEFSIKSTTIQNQDWNKKWKEGLKPFKVGNAIWIKPGRVDFTPPTDSLLIEIDPKMAFGAGTHETTGGCLVFIEEVFGYQKIKSVLDLGCGTGILAIAAKKFDSEIIYAIDNDPIALKTAQENCLMNNADNILFCKSINEIPATQTQFDMVIANILAETIIDLIGDIEKNTKDKGYVILSGILDEKAHLVESAIKSLTSLNIEKTLTNNKWVTMLARKKQT